MQDYTWMWGSEFKSSLRQVQVLTERFYTLLAELAYQLIFNYIFIKYLNRGIKWSTRII